MLRLTKQLMAMLIVILLATLGTAVQANGPAAPPDSDLTGPSPPAGAVSPEGLLNPDGTLDLSTGFQGTLDLRGWEVVLDGERGPLLKPASRPAAFQVTAWNALPRQGLNHRVHALAVVGSDLYVGGQFIQTGDGTLLNLGCIARYDTTAGTWHALPNQGLGGVINASVYALAVVGSDLYVGGNFTQTGDGTTLTNLGNIARYDTTAGTWNALPKQGLNNYVYALAVVGSDLYVGGSFTQTGDTTVTLNRIARYDTTATTWHALSNQGLNNNVLELAVSGSDLYVGGAFIQTGDTTVTNLKYIARYDTSANTWHALSNQGLNSAVIALTVSGSDLYVGGNFTQTGDTTVTLNRIARYDTTAGTWNALPKQGLNDSVYVLLVSGSDLYVGGDFTQTGDTTVTLNRIARYDTTAGTWYALPNQGFDDYVRALLVSGSDLYVGGEFTQTFDGTLTNLGHIVRGTLAVPEIQVLDGATDVPDGTGSVNWGTTTVGTPIDRTFTVHNTASTADLTLTEPITVPAGFSVANSFGSTTVAASTSTTFTIRLDAVAAGTYSGTLQFANNDGDENPFDFTISGTVSSLYEIYLPLVLK